MNKKQIIKDYFSFTRKERIGLLVLIFLIVIVIILPSIVPSGKKYQFTHADSSWLVAANNLNSKTVSTSENKLDQEDYRPVTTYRHKEETAISGALFYFDPNTIDEKGWQKLGLRDKTIHTIINYLGKGGRFKKPADLGKVYGLSPTDFDRLEPYVRIVATQQTETTKAFSEQRPSRTGRTINSIDIETADTTEFILLPGIGSKLANRIVAFREKLGGFYSIDQIGEVYGLADTTFQKLKGYFKLDKVVIKKIAINTATIEELKLHPYIRYNLARAIDGYRKEHGAFSRTEDLMKIAAVGADIYKKIEPYIAVQ